MIRPLRRRHRRWLGLLAVALPVLYAAALVSRRPIPWMDPLPPAVAAPAIEESRRVARRVQSWPGGSVRVTLLRGGVDSAARSVALEPLSELKSAELLVYWARGPAPAEAGAPGDAWLLGSLDGRRQVVLSLPAFPGDEGHLLLYDLPHQRGVLAIDLSSGAVETAAR